MPLLLRLGGLDVTLGGPPGAAHIARLSSCGCARSLAAASSEEEAHGFGWVARRRERTLGGGGGRWRRARNALETAEGLDLPWAKWWRSGVGSRWTAGDVVVVGARVLPAVWVANVNTVTKVERSRSKMSVTWATTQSHLLRGSETVAVERNSGEVKFHVQSHSRPNHVAAWLLYPVVALLQRRFTRDVCERMNDVTQSD